MRRRVSLVAFCVFLILIVALAIVNFSRPMGDQPYFIGGFTPKAAMGLLFGNFDDSKQGSVWNDVSLSTLPQDAAGHAIRAVFDGKDHAEGFAKVYRVFQPTQQTRYLFFLTIEGSESASNPPEGCHACGVLLGGAIFEKHGFFWTLRAKNLFLGAVGSWGKAPEDATLVQWLEKDYGLMVSEGDGGQGVTVVSTQFYGFDGQRLFQAFSTATGYDDCASGEEHCSSWEVQPRFVKMNGPFDVILEPNDKGAAPDAESSRFHFSGSTYIDTELGLPIEWYELIRKAKTRDAAAELEIGRGFLSGQGAILKDYKKALQWFEKAAASPTAEPRVIGEAMNEIGLMYTRGQGVPKDDVIARDWLVRAYEHGNGKSACNLGQAYLDGVPPDYDAALQWFHRATDLGIPEAVNDIGFMYASGYGVPKDETEALQWFLRASDMGSAAAANNAGLMYASQYGTNSVDALRWFSKAADMGSAEARQNLNAILADRYVAEPVAVGGNPTYIDSPAAAKMRDRAKQDIQESVGRARQYTK